MENLLVGSARHLESEGGLRDLEYLMLNLEYDCNYHCPKCSPEENPTEQCWKPGRNVLANRVIPSLNTAKYHLPLEKNI